MNGVDTDRGTSICAVCKRALRYRDSVSGEGVWGWFYWSKRIAAAHRDSEPCLPASFLESWEKSLPPIPHNPEGPKSKEDVR